MLGALLSGSLAQTIGYFYMTLVFGETCALTRRYRRLMFRSYFVLAPFHRFVALSRHEGAERTSRIRRWFRTIEFVELYNLYFLHLHMP